MTDYVTVNRLTEIRNELQTVNHKLNHLAKISNFLEQIAKNTELTPQQQQEKQNAIADILKDCCPPESVLKQMKDNLQKSLDLKDSDLTDKQKEDLSKQGYSMEIQDGDDGLRVKVLMPKQEEYKFEQFEECKPFTNLDELAEKLASDDKENKEQRDIETKLLIGKFIGTCKQYFFDVHIHRFVLPNDYERVDHIVQELLELYEDNLAYLMRNPDCKFKILTHGEMHKDHTSPNGTQHSIRRKILAVFSLESNDFNREILNNFIDCITESWRDFKKEHQEEQDQLQPKIDCPQGRNGYQCVKTTDNNCLDPKCSEYKGQQTFEEYAERLKTIASRLGGRRTPSKTPWKDARND